MRILVVEDREILLSSIAKNLIREGYSVDQCQNGTDARYTISITDYDCIVLDIMLPGVDGITLLKEMRNKGNPVPVLLLTAKDSIEDRVSGLDSGADDYLVKPFSMDELMARLRVLLRRNSENKTSELSAEDLTLNLLNHEATRAGRKIELTSKEYAILEFLLRNKNRVMTREQIVEHVWNYDFDCSSNIVDVYIRYLRTKIDQDFDRKLITTIRGYGYTIREEGKAD